MVAEVHPQQSEMIRIDVAPSRIKQLLGNQNAIRKEKPRRPPLCANDEQTPRLRLSFAQFPRGPAHLKSLGEWDG